MCKRGEMVVKTVSFFFESLFVVTIILKLDFVLKEINEEKSD